MNRRKALETTELLSPAEAAALLDVTPATVRRWAKSGYLNYVLMPSGRMRYKESDVLALLAPVEAQGEDLDLSLDVPFPALAGGRF